MIEKAIGIVLTIVIFMVIAYSFLNLWGTPTCASLANQTALQLKFAVDMVAENKPVYDSNDIPSDSRYYETVPIRLCQKYGTYNFFMQFFGGMPEYQIYYEHFPEGGGGTWNEAYPWSGGAGSTLIFWSAMRGISIVGGLAKRLTTVYQGFKTLQFLKKSSSIGIKRAVQSFTFVQKLSSFKSFFWEFVKAGSPPNIIVEGRLLDNFTDKIRKNDSTEILKLMGDEGFVKTQGNTENDFKYEAVGDKIVLKNADIPLTITTLEGNGDRYEEQELYVYCEGCNGVLDPEKADWSDTPAVPVGRTFSEIYPNLDSNNYIPLKINPREEMKKIYDSLKESQPENAKEIEENFAFEDGAMESNVSNSSYIKKIYNEMEKRNNDVKSYLARNFYNQEGSDNKYTMQTSEEIFWRAKALENITETPDREEHGRIGGTDVPASDFKEKIILKMINYDAYGFEDKLKAFASLYGLSLSTEIKPEEAARVVLKMWEDDDGGFTFYHESDLTNVFVRIKDAIILKDGITNANEIVNEVKKLYGYDQYFKVYEDHGRITKIATDLLNIYNGIVIPNAQEKYENFSFELELYQLKNIATELAEVDKDSSAVYGVDKERIKELIENQIGMVIGLFDRSDNAKQFNLWPRSPLRPIKRMIFFKAMQFFAPNSWIGQGLILQRMTDKCQGNSICLYVHASQYEDPYYLNETASNYDLRVWRPVQPWTQWGLALWTAALMRVPSHPSFYVVSPCFAVAKVWKTNLDGQQTIFIYPAKIPMEDHSNYCYADSDLINAYTGIWAASDSITIIETVLTWGVSNWKIGTKTVAKAEDIAIKTQTKFGLLVDKTLGAWKMIDPATIFQATAESLISWPGPPFAELNYTDMQEGSTNYELYRDLEDSMKNAYG